VPYSVIGYLVNGAL